MKSYFVKLLPIEGQVKEGEKFKILINDTEWDEYTLYIDHGIGFCDCKKTGTYSGKGMVSYPYHRTIETIDKKFIKVHDLFLCSNEINVGDRVYNKLSGYGVVKEITTEEAFLGVKYDLEEFEAEEDFEHIIKVVGVISKEAVWVSHGDELKEEEIKLVPEMDFHTWYHKNYQPNKRMVDYHKNYDKYCITANKIAQILNTTCKHFH